MNLVLDASVILKWVFLNSELEEHKEQALAILAGVQDGSITLLQPSHWLVEVAAVVSREQPEIAEETIDLLDAMDLQVVNDVFVMKRASLIARELKHHLFDTLYHAVGLEYGLPVVTADDHYFRKAKGIGQLVLLKDWPHISNP